MADSTRQMLASVPADTTPEQLTALLGEAQPPEAPSPERQAELEAFGLAATELQRINLELLEVATGARAFWNADDVAQGALDESLGRSGIVPATFGPALSRAALALVAAAEARGDDFTMHLQAPVEDPGAGELVIEWLTRHEPAVEVVALANAETTALHAEVAAIVDALALAGDTVRGRLSIRTFGPADL